MDTVELSLGVRVANRRTFWIATSDQEALLFVVSILGL